MAQFSAFANALLIAHEIAGKRADIVRSLTGGGSSDETPLHAVRQLDAERAAYQEEMQFLHEAGADYSGHAQWCQAMENFERSKELAMPQVIESFGEFCQRQGCEYINLGSEVSGAGHEVNRYVFANGAYSDSTGHYDPPADEKVRLMVQRDFLKTKLRREERDFKEFRQTVVNQAACTLATQIFRP